MQQVISNHAMLPLIPLCHHRTGSTPWPPCVFSNHELHHIVLTAYPYGHETGSMTAVVGTIFAGPCYGASDDSIMCMCLQVFKRLLASDALGQASLLITSDLAFMPVISDLHSSASSVWLLTDATSDAGEAFRRVSDWCMPWALFLQRCLDLASGELLK